MYTLPKPTRLACIECDATVVMLRLVDGGQPQAFPCGHAAGYLSVPDHEPAPKTAA